MTITIAVDVDCVLSDLIPAWLAWYNNLANDHLQVSEITDWDLSKFVHPDWKTEIFQFLRIPDAYDYVKPIRNSQAGVKLLLNYGRVIFLTTEVEGRSYRKLGWLRSNGFAPSFKDYFEAPDKSVFRYDILIDDGLHNFWQDDSHGLRIVYDQPWNREHPRWDDYDYRLNGWELPYLKEIMESIV